MSGATTASGELEQLRRQVRRRALRGGARAWGAVAVPVTTAAVWLASGERLHGGAVAATLSLAWLAALTVAAHGCLWRPWRRHADCAAFARDVEARGDFGNLVVAAEEAGRRPDRWPDEDPVARELGRRLDEGARRALSSLAPGDLAPTGRAGLQWSCLAAGLMAAALLAAIRPGEAARGLALLLQPLADTRTAEPALVAEAAAPWVVAGGRVRLAALDYADESAAAEAEVRFGDAAWVRLPATAERLFPGGDVIPAAEADAPRRRWVAAVEDVREDFSWRFRRGGVVTGTGRVEVRQPPLLSRLSATVQPPAYTGLPRLEVERLPALSEVPDGSRVALRAVAGPGLEAAWLSLATGDSLPMRVAGEAGTATLTVTAATTFTVNLRDGHGLASRDGLAYRLAVLADQPPAVRLERPSDDGQLPLDGRVTLLVEATDDYGLADLALQVALGAAESQPVSAALSFGPRATGQWRSVAIGAGELRLRARELDGHEPPLRAVVALDVEAGALELLPGDVLALTAAARDNRVPGPGQVARSATLRLAVPSAAEVLAGQAEAAEQSRGELEEARRRGRELDADLERLARELLKNPVPDWARQQEIDAALERQQALQRELARVADELRRQMDQLASGQLTSEAQMERAEQMAELLAPQAGEELAALLEKLEQPGAQVSPDDVRRAMEEVGQSQKDLARRLDAALALLERMADEQRLEGLTSLLEDMMRRQQELADLSRRLEDQPRPSAGEPPAQEPPGGKPDAAELARRQEALERELEQLQDKLEQALAEMSASREERQPDGAKPESGAESPPEGDAKGEPERGPKDASPQEKALREALEKLKQQKSSGSMGQASEMLQKMDPGQAAQMQQQALRDLGSLYSVLLASQQAMQSAMKMEQVSSLRGLAADLLALSGRQEELGTRIPAQLQDVRNTELTRQQHRLQKAAIGTRDRLALLQHEAPNRILKLLEKLDGLIEQMGGTVRALDEGRAAAARDQSGRSLAEANRIVIGLLTEAQMASNGGGGGGSQQQSASEQLQELARQQAELNGATEELRRMLADRGISQEMRSKMQRLGEQQAELGRQLGRVAEREHERPAGDGGRLLGDMTELGRQMERVGGDLGEGLVDQEVLQRQDRILGRLLDARNAVRERDYSARRESRTAGGLYGRQDGLDGRAGSGGEAGARQRYQRLEDAPLEYRELVRRYFAAIDSLQGTGAGDGRGGVLP